MCSYTTRAGALEAAARRDPARHDDDVGHAKTAGVPRRPVYRGARSCGRRTGRRSGAPRLTTPFCRVRHGAAPHSGDRGDARPRSAEPATNVQRDPGRWRPLIRRHGASGRCHPLVHRFSQLARSSGAAHAARKWWWYHHDRQIGHTGRKEPQDSFGWLWPLCVHHRCKSCWSSCGKRVTGISRSHVTILSKVVSCGRQLWPT